MLVAPVLCLVGLLHAVELPKNGPGLLRLELSDLYLSLPILVLTRLFDAVVALLHEIERLRHVFLPLDERLQLSLPLIDLVYGIIGLLDVALLLLQALDLGLLVLFELGSRLLGLTQILLQLGEHLSC